MAGACGGGGDSSSRTPIIAESDVNHSAQSTLRLLELLRHLTGGT